MVDEVQEIKTYQSKVSLHQVLLRHKLIQSRLRRNDKSCVRDFICHLLLTLATPLRSEFPFDSAS